MLSEQLTAEERKARRREYMREYCRQYRAAHWEKMRENGRHHYAAHRQKVLERKKQYRAEHLEKMHECDRRYRDAHREERREQKREYQRACSRRYRNAHPDCGTRPCVDCGEPCKGHSPAPRCRKCAVLYYRGDRNPTYKGGWITPAGYRQFTNGRENRLIWEAAHGPLSKGWIVHHLNGEKADNRLCNLLAMPNGSHVKLHWLMAAGAFTPGQATEEARRLVVGKALTLAEARKALRAQYGGDPSKQASYERNLLRPSWAGRMSRVERAYVCQALYEQTRKLLATVPRRTGTGPGVV